MASLQAGTDVQRREPEFAALAKLLPVELIHEVLRETGKSAKRRRKLPPELVVFLLVGMGVFRRLSITSVLERVVDAAGAALKFGIRELPHATSIAQARDRLGWEAVRLLFHKFTRTISSKHGNSTLWHGLKVFALDATTFRVPDTKENEAWFGRPGSRRGGPSAFPQLRAVMLMGAWTHLITDVVFGPYTMNELKIAEFLLDRLSTGSLLLLDRAYSGFTWPARFVQRGVHFIVRSRKGHFSPLRHKRKRLGKGDWLCVLPKNKSLARKYPDLPDAITVRAITVRRPGFRPTVLVTSLVSPEFSAAELATLYRDRWEIELGYRELKTYLAAEYVSFRSQQPERVLQEAYGLLIAYNCVRALTCDAAVEAGVRPTQLSFTRSLERLRHFLLQTSNDTDADLERRYLDLVQRAAGYRLSARREGRRCDRAVKVQSSKYPRKRRGMKSKPTRYQRQRLQAYGLIH